MEVVYRKCLSAESLRQLSELRTNELLNGYKEES